jgi:hypothetical protein
MNNWACQLHKSPDEKTERVEIQDNESKKNIGRRILVLLLMIYLAVMVNAALYVSGNIFVGFYFWSGGHKLFPIPYNPAWFGNITASVITPLNPIECFIYAIFINHGIWIFWLGIGIIYIVYPWLSHLHAFVGNLKSKPTGQESSRVVPNSSTV